MNNNERTACKKADAEHMGIAYETAHLTNTYANS